MNKYTKSTQVRLEMLERQNRWLTILAIATIITVLFIATGGPAVVRATTIQLLDEDNNDRTELSLNNETLGLYVKSEFGEVTNLFKSVTADR